MADTNKLTEEQMLQRVTAAESLLTETQKRAERAETILKLSPTHRQCFDEMNRLEQDAFLSADEATRKAQLEKAEKRLKGEESEEELKKTASGRALLEVRKQNAELLERVNKADELAKAEREARLTAEFSKTASTVYKSLPGTDDEKGKLLKKLHAQLDKETFGEVEEMLKKADTAFHSLMTSKGVDSTDDTPAGDDPEAQLTAMAQKRAQEKGITLTKAMSEVLNENRKMYDQADARRKRPS